MSIKHKENLNLLLNLLISSIYAKSAPKILFIKAKCNFGLLTFLIICLCNSSTNYF